METKLIRGLYGYHHWANRTLFDVARGLGAEAAARDVGKHWSFPTLTRMFSHIYGADWVWLQRFQGASPTTVPGPEFATLNALRPAWDALEAEQRAHVDGLSEADLARVVSFKNTRGIEGHVALGPLLQHVVNHATHHRSEVATMVTMTKGSPAPTDMVLYYRQPKP
jgi:uncharacterized damage-inducible protein DinB